MRNAECVHSFVIGLASGVDARPLHQVFNQSAHAPYGILKELKPLGIRLVQGARPIALK